MNTDKMTNRTGRKRLLAALAAVALLAAACGSGDDEGAPTVADIPAADGDSAAGSTDGSGDDGGESLSPEEAQLAFEQCMEKQGVDISLSGGGDGESLDGDDDDGRSSAGEVGEDFDKFEAAMDECNSLLGNAFDDFDRSPEEEAAMKDAEAAFAQCMEEQGFPQSSGDDDDTVDDDDGAGFSFQIDENADQDEVDAAFRACESIFDDAGLGADQSEGGDA
ncbi:MAG: hypothetical protein AAGD35_10810 [Actinomycetota bacterium]